MSGTIHFSRTSQAPKFTPRSFEKAGSPCPASVSDAREPEIFWAKASPDILTAAKATAPPKVFLKKSLRCIVLIKFGIGRQSAKPKRKGNNGFSGGAMSIKTKAQGKPQNTSPKKQNRSWAE